MDKGKPKTWAGKLTPAIEAKYAEARMKGPANIKEALRLNAILNALEQEEKLGPTMQDRLDKMIRPKKKDEDEEESLAKKLFGKD